MSNLFDFPRILFALSLPALWLSAWIGARLGNMRGDAAKDWRGDFDIILAAALTLLGLVIGFTFSMAVSRYDQRKNYEAEEANAIGTEYVRAGLLPAVEAANVRALLRKYLDQRLLFYHNRDKQKFQKVDADTAQLQNELWTAVETHAAVQPTPVVALTVSGMNDVLNAQGYTQAAWLNRIPIAGWDLLILIAILCNMLVGYRAQRTNVLLFLILPLVVSISFFLIADIDSPNQGTIRVHPQNIESLSHSLR